MENVLDYRIMEKARVLTCPTAANERKVQWISAIEMPVENFVRQDEVVLTTAMGCKNDLEALKTFLQEVIDSGASALMIAVGRHIYDIPSEVIELAEKQNFPLIELPWEIRFSNIVEEVMKDLTEEQDQERRESEKVQQELLQLILTNTDLSGIVRYIRRLIGNPVIVSDRTGIILETSGVTQSFLEKWQEVTAEGDLPVRQEGKSETRELFLQRFQSAPVGSQEVLQLPILQPTGHAQGFLFAVLPAGASPTSFLTRSRIHVFEHASTTVALWFSRQTAIDETKMSLRSDFVQELAKGNFDSVSQADTRAKLLGYNLELPYVCLIGQPENLQELLQKHEGDPVSAVQWKKGMLRYLEEEIGHAARHFGRKVMITDAEEQLLMFLEVTPGKEMENAMGFLDFIGRRLRNLLPEVLISWGAGDSHKGIGGFAASYSNAAAALRIGRHKKGAGGHTHYQETRIDRVLLDLAQSREMQNIILSAITPVITYDRQRNMDLIGTFSAYNRYNGNVSQTARALNLHRQSLLYRLRKIESLTGLSLLDPDDLFLLELSIRTWEAGLKDGGP